MKTGTQVFANGRGASVIKVGALFEVCLMDEDDTLDDWPVVGLTAEEAEKEVERIAALPRKIKNPGPMIPAITRAIVAAVIESSDPYANPPAWPEGWSCVLCELGEQADAPLGTPVWCGDRLGFTWGDTGSVLVPAG